MSLDFHLDGIKNYKTVCWLRGDDIPEGTPGFMLNDKGALMNPVTHKIIWATMSVGIGEIRTSNWQEFYARLWICELIWGVDTKTTPEDVRRHIGLRTNVFPEETRAQWRKRVLDYQLDKKVREAESIIEG